MTITLITDYLGAGVAASRPVAPVPPTGALVVYIATDTGVVSVWNGTSWVQGTYAGGATANPEWTSGAGVPIAVKPVGSLYSNTTGGVGTTLYVSRGAGTWLAIAGV